jgi:membrane protein DedA with SNARE-associated domain
MSEPARHISTTVSLLGFLTLFWVGGFLGRHFFIERDYRFLRAKDIIKAEEWFGRYGYFLILFNRFMPGIRSAVALPQGYPVSGPSLWRASLS